ILQHWDVFKYVTEVFILVPALLGLKGNLEMTLASRLSTAVSVQGAGQGQGHLTWGGLCVWVVQATVVGFLASIAAVVFGWIPDGHFSLDHAVLLCASSVATAFIASLVLGMIMIGVIIGSRRMGINPDNVATPIAASLGDLITLALLSGISWGLYKELGEEQQKALVSALLSFLPLPSLLLKSGIEVKNSLSYITPSPGTSRPAGCWEELLEVSVPCPECCLCPAGVGGNLVAVQASRISTYLHMSGEPGDSPGTAPRKCPSPCSTFFSPGRFQLGFLSCACAFLGCACAFLGCACAFLGCACAFLGCASVFWVVPVPFWGVLILLYIADWMVHWMWGRHLDPDNFSIPYLTALGDLLGTGLLALSFHVLWLIGDRDSDVGD
ncbi:S41A1 protein, partial [Chloropsis hardwickii]|nr:S41A1 protein [Chloropsis hardwickii]